MRLNDEKFKMRNLINRASLVSGPTLESRGLESQ